MTIQVGDTIPAGKFKIMSSEGPKDISTDEIFTGKKVVLFAVPGAFTPGCTAVHLPGFVVHADTIKAKGVDTIACTSTNDAFVLSAWGDAQNAEEIKMLADGNGDFARSIGLEMDASVVGMGKRSKRYAMIVDDGTVSYLAVDAPGKVEVSTADGVLEVL